ncbi:fibroblast growth factor receptor 2 isoform 5 precursor [Apostichopus japonicus]|uniref:Fibroblast growth factor receptor 2 isoform 5 n=1 Tax=Stichopus japonicus TaxID=307972 RepID=A0A2G8KUC0_STIJA|nr:fibroblast growth factor receptor 2 isoform 5 precursor [Apostichopus japonicus]
MDISVSSDVIWRRHDERIFLNEHRLVDDNILRDVCHPTFSSLFIPTVTFHNANETYQCKSQNGTTVTFILRVIVSRSFCSEIMKRLECIANEVLQPVTMKWTVNNNEISSKTFYEISNQTVAWTKTFNILRETDVVKCKVSGPYITQVTTSFNCSRNDEELGSDGTRLLLAVFTITLLCFIALIIILTDTFIVRRSQQNVVYFYGENVVYHRSDILLEKRLQSSGRMIRWTASLQNGKRPPFIANTLPAPHFIYTEYVTNGTLKEFLGQSSDGNEYSTSIYSPHGDSATAYVKIKQLASFSYEVLDAMIFLESIDCDHPGVCAKKVLMNSRNVCKLYDFNACSTTKKFISGKDFEAYTGYFLVAGETPFIQRTFGDIKSAFDESPPLSQPNRCPNEIYLLMKRSLCLQPETRIKLAKLKEGLKRFIDGESVVSKDFDCFDYKII